VIRASSGKTAAGRLLIGVGALALLIPAAAGCEAGNDAPTLQFHSASAGAHTVFNNITITNVFVLGAPVNSTVPAGSSASVFLALYNGGDNADTLESVTAPGAAGSVTLPAGSVALPASTPVNLTGPQPEVVLEDLKAPLRGGSNIPLTLTFAHAGTVELTVPVQAQSFYYSTYSAPAPAPASASASASVSKRASATMTPKPTPTK
jgi:copper(I)-binding protein